VKTAEVDEQKTKYLQHSINAGCKWNVYLCLSWHDCVMFINKML
jgi:hypothetical protein